MSDTATISPEVKDSLRSAIYGNGTPSTPQNPIQAAQQAQQQQAATSPTAPAATLQTTPSEQTNTTPSDNGNPAPDYNAYLKTKFGFDNEESALSAFQEYSNWKQNPPQAPAITFADDTSKRIHEALRTGKVDEAYNYLHGQRQLNGLDAMNEEQKLKLFIRMNNPLYDQQLIDYEFNRNYKFNEADFKDEDGNITDPLAFRYAQTQALQKMQNDVAKASEYFGQYKNKISLPEIDKPAIDPGYQEFQQLVQQQADGQKALDEAVLKLTDQDAVFSTKFVDEANKLNFDLAFTPNAQQLEAGKKAMVNVLEFMDGNFRNADGSPQTAKLLSHMTILANLGAFANTVAAQAINADRKRFMTEAKQPGGIQRNYNIDVGQEAQMDQNRTNIYGKTA